MYAPSTELAPSSNVLTLLTLIHGFTQSVPALEDSVLLEDRQSAVPASELVGAAANWRTADGYYFRGIARIQRLYEVCHS